MGTASFFEQLRFARKSLTPGERRVIDYLARNRESALLASAAEMARDVGTSDATVIRTARKLGFSGLDGLRQALASDLRRELSLSDRVENELRRSPDGPTGALAQINVTLRATLQAMERIPSRDLAQAVTILGAARRVHVFGIGPSGHIAGYFATQLTRLGADARALRNTGLQLADDLITIGAGDAVLALAYDRPYPEVTALFDHAQTLNLRTILISSTGPLRPDDRADVMLPVARGRPDGFGLHAGTLAMLEALLVAFAAENRGVAQQGLKNLNKARQEIAGQGMRL